ncbi:MAG: acyloxyacyl hydrolase [Pseudomonadota bacterium]
MTSSAAVASELTIGVGSEISMFDGEEDGSLSIDWHADTWRTIGQASISWGVASEIQTSGDVWAGAGAKLGLPLGPSRKTRFDLSLHGGLYSEGSSGHDLGGSIQFRTRIGFTHFLRPDLGIGVSLQHKSNAGLDDDNPGSESVHILLSKKY